MLCDGLLKLGNPRLLNAGLFRQHIKVVLQNGNPYDLYDDHKKKECRCAGEKLFGS